MAVIETRPMQIDACDGVVIADGMPGVTATMTADAALETSDRLFEAATLAQGQVVEYRSHALPKAP